MKRPRWSTVLEAIHAENPDERGWISTILDAVGPLFQTAHPEMGFVSLEHAADATHPRLGNVVGAHEPFVPSARELVQRLDPASLRELFYPPQMVTPMQSIIPRMPAADEIHDHLQRWRSAEGLGIAVHPEPGVAAVLYSSNPPPSALAPAFRAALTKIGLHLETNVRLRRRPDLVRAVLTPNGKVEDGNGDPRLTAAVAAIERARLERNDGEALDLWPALVGGRLSLVERLDGHRRYYLAIENAPTTQPIRTLNQSELDAISYAARGFSLKMIGYALGIAPSEASRRLGAAAAKVGVASTLELVRIAAMFARDPRARFAKTALTASERDILDLLAQGFSNKQIATMRNRSVRTIANQVASLLRKTNKASRRELIARL